MPRYRAELTIIFVAERREHAEALTAALALACYTTLLQDETRPEEAFTIERRLYETGPGWRRRAMTGLTRVVRRGGWLRTLWRLLRGERRR